MANDQKAKADMSKFLFRFFKVLVILSLIFTIIAKILVIKAGVENNDLNGLDKTFVVLSESGNIIICFLIGLSEFEFDWYKRAVLILYYYFGRGFACIWVGINTISSSRQLGASVHESTDINVEAVVTFGTVCGWILIGIGVVYCLLAFACGVHGKDDKNKDQELEEGFLGGGDKKKGDAGSSAADALLIANMAIAMGVSSDDCRKRFAGKNGAKAAQEFAKTRAKAASIKLPTPPAGAKGQEPEPAPRNDYGYASASAPQPERAAAAPDNDSFGKKKVDDDLDAMYYSQYSS